MRSGGWRRRSDEWPRRERATAALCSLPANAFARCWPRHVLCFSRCLSLLLARCRSHCFPCLSFRRRSSSLCADHRERRVAEGPSAAPPPPPTGQHPWRVPKHLPAEPHEEQAALPTSAAAAAATPVPALSPMSQVRESTWNVLQDNGPNHLGSWWSHRAGHARRPDHPRGGRPPRSPARRQGRRRSGAATRGGPTAACHHRAGDAANRPLLHSLSGEPLPQPWPPSPTAAPHARVKHAHGRTGTCSTRVR